MHGAHAPRLTADRTAQAVLSFHQLVENSDESFLLDNEALYDICALGPEFFFDVSVRSFVSNYLPYLTLSYLTLPYLPTPWKSTRSRHRVSG